MERRFGHDFSRVRVHNDEKSAATTRACGALAYTTGSDIVFGTDLSHVPVREQAPRFTIGIGLLQRCGGLPEPCPCHDTEPDTIGRLHRSARGRVDAGTIPDEVRSVLATNGSPLPGTVRAAMELGFDSLVPPAAIDPARGPAPGKSRISAPTDASERQAAVVAQQIAGVRPPFPEDANPVAGAMPRRGWYDFSGLRIHTDERAGAAAAAVHASAFTVGSHIVFAPGTYSPGTAGGRRLMAHELAHVIQHGKAPDLDAQPVFREALDGGVSRNPDAGTSPDPLDAGAPDERLRRWQLACVGNMGGCHIPGGIPTAEQIAEYNRICREKYPGAPEVTPTNDECSNLPKEPLTTAEKILIGALVVAGAAVAVAVIVVAGEVVIPIVIAEAELAGSAAAGAWAYYFANAIVINEVGVFAAGLIIGCEGDVPGLLKAMANDPLLAAQILAEVYILHVNIQVANGPVRKATVPVKILPPSEQTKPQVLVKSVGPPTFEATEAPPAPVTPGKPTNVPAEAPVTPPAKKAPQPPVKTYYGGGGGVRKGMKTTPMPEPEHAPTGQPGRPVRARPSTRLTEVEQTLVAEAEQASSKLGRPLQVKTKAATGGGDVVRSGYGKGGGGAARTKQVLDVGKEIGHEFERNASLDGAIPGQAAASHAEKLAAVSNPGRALAVDRAICPDCVEFFRRYARARNGTVVIHEPGQTWVFRPDGVQVGISGSAAVVLYPGGASAEPLPSSPR